MRGYPRTTVEKLGELGGKQDIPRGFSSIMYFLPVLTRTIYFTMVIAVGTQIYGRSLYPCLE